MPLVSVVMPVYNASAFLRDAIMSILNQSFHDFEFIIVNDGSTDNSESIIKSYHDERILYIYQENGGVANALNKGISLATGKYIWRHDADDTSLPEKLKEQVDFLENNEDFALCATQIAFMTEGGKIAYNYRQPKNCFFGNSYFVEVKRTHFNPYSPITHATVLIRSKILSDLGGFRTEFKTAEDVDLWLRLLHNNRAAVLNNCNYFVRLNKTSATRKHGWKNAFFRNLALEYYDQREAEGVDDIQRGVPLNLPPAPKEMNLIEESSVSGKTYRDDLLDFQYPLHLNAKDWPATIEIAKNAIQDGWKLQNTWKSLLFPLLGKSLTQYGVRLKKIVK